MVINIDDLKVMCGIERDNVLHMYISPLLTRNDFQTEFFSPFSQIKENSIHTYDFLVQLHRTLSDLLTRSRY